MDFYISALEVSALRRQEDDAGVYHDKENYINGEFGIVVKQTNGYL